MPKNENFGITSSLGIVTNRGYQLQSCVVHTKAGRIYRTAMSPPVAPLVSLVAQHHTVSGGDKLFVGAFDHVFQAFFSPYTTDVRPHPRLRTAAMARQLSACSWALVVEARGPS